MLHESTGDEGGVMNNKMGKELIKMQEEENMEPKTQVKCIYSRVFNCHNGLTAAHQTITKDCVEAHGKENVFNVAAQRVKEKYDGCKDKWPDRAKFHLVLLIES